MGVTVTPLVSRRARRKTQSLKDIGITDFPSLQILSLAVNQVSERGLGTLMAASASLVALEELYLDHNHIMDPQCVLQALSADALPCLRTLALHFNPFMQAGRVALGRRVVRTWSGAEQARKLGYKEPETFEFAVLRVGQREVRALVHPPVCERGVSLCWCTLPCLHMSESR